MAVSDSSILLMGFIAFILRDFIESVLPTDWIKYLNHGLKGHADGVLLRIEADVRKEFLELWNQRVKLSIGTAGILLPLVNVWAVEMFKPTTVEPVLGTFLLIISSAFTCIGVCLLFHPIAKLSMTLAFAVPLYLLFLFVSKCHRGAVVAYSLSISLLVFVLQGLSIAQ